MTRETDDRPSRHDVERRQAARRASIPVGVVAVAAVVALTVSDPGDSSGPLLWGVPMLALFALLTWVELRDLRRADEYQRTLLLEALALGFAVVLALLLVGGVVSSAGVGDARQWMQISFLGGGVTWGVAKAVKTRQS